MCVLGIRLIFALVPPPHNALASALGSFEYINTWFQQTLRNASLRGHSGVGTTHREELPRTFGRSYSARVASGTLNNPSTRERTAFMVTRRSIWDDLDGGAQVKGDIVSSIYKQARWRGKKRKPLVLTQS